VILVEALSVIDESRGRLHQLTALPQNQAALAKFAQEMKKINDKPLMLWQLTHSGELSHPEFSKRVCVKPFPGYEGELLTEEQVDEHPSTSSFWRRRWPTTAAPMAST